MVVSGQLTAFLRARWGLLKIREESDRHHALDAAVVAACTHGMVKRLSDYARRRELEHVSAGFVDLQTGEIVDSAAYAQLERHFPAPWPNFRHELESRLKVDDPALLRAEMERLGTYPTEALEALRPLFVSRAVARRGGGEIHEAKILAVKSAEPKKALERVPLAALTLNKLEKMVGKDDPRNHALYDVLRERLVAFGDDPKKAFNERQPVLKPSGDGKIAPKVSSIRVEATQNTGLLVRGGIAALGEMLRVEVFCRDGGYLIVPKYEAATEKMRGAPSIPTDASFCFELTKNDFVEIIIGNETVRGYFVMYESDGRVTLRAHDQPLPDKKYFRRAVATASRITKFHVDILGNLYAARREPRRGLA